MEIDRDAPVRARAELLIDAPLAQVWSILTDIADWSRWNPGVNRVVVDGPIEAGTEFAWRSGRLPITSRLQAVEPQRQIAWTGRTLGLDAVHVWGFEPHEQGVMVCTEESLDGTLARWFQARMQRMLQQLVRPPGTHVHGEIHHLGRDRLMAQRAVPVSLPPLRPVDGARPIAVQ